MSRTAKDLELLIDVSDQIIKDNPGKVWKDDPYWRISTPCLKCSHSNLNLPDGWEIKNNRIENIDCPSLFINLATNS